MINSETKMKTLSKSKYLAGLSCSKLLWCYFNAPDLIPPPDEALQFIFDQGHEVGDLAKKLHPRGIEIPLTKDAVVQTKNALANRVPIFEGSFSHNYCYCKVDILLPVNDNEWDIIEVKSSTQVKDEHIDDAAFQWFVLKGCGLNIRRVHIRVINNEYVRLGEVDIDKLFNTTDITEQAEELLSMVPENVESFQKIIAGSSPKIQFGIDCKEPNNCPVCSKDVDNMEICELYRLGKKAWSFVNEGVTKIKDLPKSLKLNEKQRIQCEAVKTGAPFIDKKALKDFFHTLTYPLSFFDFETVNTAVPLFDGVKPYQQVPFQFSLHIIEKEGSTPKHVEFLADGSNDPREELVNALRNIPEDGTILAFNMSFERRVLEDLAERFPEESEFLHEIIDRMKDLIVPFRDFSYYHPMQHGSCSIKNILPAVVGKGYKDLAISDGGMASRSFLKILQGKVSKEEANSIRKGLLKYCGQDTEGMVEIMQAIFNLT